MNAAEITAAAREMLLTTLLFVTPFLAASFVVGIAVGLIQGGTRMSDLTLSFVPRLAAVLIAIYLVSTWVGKRMVDYVERAAVATISVTE